MAKFSAETEEGQTLNIWAEGGELMLLILHEQGSRYAVLSLEQARELKAIIQEMEAKL